MKLLKKEFISIVFIVLAMPVHLLSAIPAGASNDGVLRSSSSFIGESSVEREDDSGDCDIENDRKSTNASPTNNSDSADCNPAGIADILSTSSLLDPDNMLAFVKRFLPESPTILEAGGHFGEDTNRMKIVWPDATMHVFEALPSSFKVMVDATQHLSNVKCYPYCLTNYSGTTSFYIDFHNNGASSIDYPVEWNEHEFYKTPIEVPCTTLDDWASTDSISSVDFIWFDLEGHELYVLQKALSLLKSIKAIYTEISFQPIRKNSTSYFDLRRFLEAQGFCEVWKSSETGLFGDALFVKANLLQPSED